MRLLGSHYNAELQTSTYVLHYAVETAEGQGFYIFKENENEERKSSENGFYKRVLSKPFVSLTLTFLLQFRENMYS